MELESFSEVLAAIKKNKGRQFHLILGNGFSIAFDPKIFSYNALYNFVKSFKDQDVLKIFDVIATKNFEVIMQHLDSCSRIIGALEGNTLLRERIDAASEKLKEGLLAAVKELHPEHVFKISDDQLKCCAQFLNAFIQTGGSVFSTNYDLLLYWVLLRAGISPHVDGCGRKLENPDEVASGETEEWSDLVWGKYKDSQNIFYNHGALQFFDSGSSISKEEYDTRNYLLEKINSRMEDGEYPIFVTAGDGGQKLEQIMHNQYLAHCYESLESSVGSLVTFGFNFGDADKHIIDAINVAARRKPPRRLWSIYIGVYSDDDRKRIESISEKFKCKVHIYDAKTANVWG
jgi:hypothetical protein